jgi:hypothetical protein
LHWIKLRRAEGREIWVVVGYKKGVVLYKIWRHIVQGLIPEEFLKRTISHKELADEITAYCGPTRAIYDQQQQLQKCSGGERDPAAD